MSILIRGMEMPSIGNETIIRIQSGGGILDQYGHHLYCEAVPVMPHGDLIDRREAIIDANERAYDFWLSDDEVNATIQFLNEQTTIIPAEEGE
jgi:hypothetical protein